jgi:anti-anti-sigma factor
MATNSSSVKFIQLAGILDHRRSAEIQRQLNSLCLGTGNTVVMNLQNVIHMNSSGVGVLVLLLKQLQASQVQFYLSRPSASVMLTLQISGMLNTFSIYGPDRTYPASPPSAPQLDKIGTCNLSK